MRSQIRFRHARRGGGGQGSGGEHPANGRGRIRRPQATVDTLNAHGFAFGFPGKDQPSDAVMPHGTGHRLGLAVHEPPLLDDKGVALVKGDVVTIEPGLYGTWWVASG